LASVLVRNIIRTFVCFSLDYELTFVYCEPMDRLTQAQQGAQDLAAALQASLVGIPESTFQLLLGRLSDVRFSVSDVGNCSIEQANVGLAATETAIRSLQALAVGFVNRMAGGRDTIESITRSTGVSAGTARDLAAVASVVELNHEAGSLLQSGELSVDHLRTLAKLDAAAITDLLPHGLVQSADQFRRTVTQHRINNDATSLSEEQQSSRSIKFFRKRNGCVGASIVLPPIEGSEFANTINELCDQAWTAAHPQRATTRGGHTAEPRERRLADALIHWMRSKTLKLGKPAIIVTIDAETLEAELNPNQPIPLNDAVKILARADVYAAIRDGTQFENLQFGRNKRVATAIQRLALLVSQPTCVYPGCAVAGTRSDVHHIIEWEHGGSTDMANLCHVCTAHHQHLHLNGERLVHRQGRWKVHRKDSRADTAAA
jgi:hypothetical protein